RQLPPLTPVDSDSRPSRFSTPAGAIPSHPSPCVLTGKLPREMLKDRVVLIGANAVRMGDVLPTPYSGLAAPMPGVEIHANIYNALVQQRLISSLPTPVQFALALSFVLILLALLPRQAPGRNLPLALALATASLVLSLGLLQLLGVWFAPMVTLAGLTLAYLSWSWQRLISLNRFLGQEVQRLSQEPTLLLSQQPA